MAQPAEVLPSPQPLLPLSPDSEVLGEQVILAPLNFGIRVTGFGEFGPEILATE